VLVSGVIRGLVRMNLVRDATVSDGKVNPIDLEPAKLRDEGHIEHHTFENVILLCKN